MQRGREAPSDGKDEIAPPRLLQVVEDAPRNGALRGRKNAGGKKAQAQAQASQEEQRAAQQELARKFKRSMALCLEARGYPTE